MFRCIVAMLMYYGYHILNLEHVSSWAASDAHYLLEWHNSLSFQNNSSFGSYILS
ncbi:hypothetical protein BDV06DRAFT_191737 [Aspergillus oleicola]